jgi:hypothetical protein
MRHSVRLVVMILVWMCCANAQEPQQAVQTTGVGKADQPVAPKHEWAHRTPAAAPKQQPVPSIIQSELDRSRAEAVQAKSVAPVPAPVPQPAPKAPLWPLAVSLVTGALATGGVVSYGIRRKRQSPVRTPHAPSAGIQRQEAVSALPQQSPRMQRAEEPVLEYAVERIDDTVVASASPYVNDGETEMPEAALTEVMKRIQRREPPQHIAEALRIGIGEVRLAMTLAKLKK